MAGHRLLSALDLSLVIILMNPFTQFLRQWSKNPSLDTFIIYWDRLEKLTIQIYREKMTVDEARPEFEAVWPWLRVQYGRWRAALEPFWQATNVGGQPTQTDPFQLLLEKRSPEDICGDWHMMQHLPAAREALNHYLMAKSA